MLAAVNQYRSALHGETFGYWRTLYENLITSRIVSQLSEQDPELPGRFVYYTLENYRHLNSLIGELDPWYADHKTEVDLYWEKAIDSVREFRRRKAQGDYAWAYPLITTKKGEPKVRPTFGDLIQLVDKDSICSKVYYRTTSAQGHGQLLWLPPITRPASSMSVSYDPYSTGDIARVLELTLPIYREIVSNAGSLGEGEFHRCMMKVASSAFVDVEGSVQAVKSKVPPSIGGQ